MPATPLITFGSFFLSMIIFTLLGRVICRNTATERMVMSTGLYYLLTGMSVWYLLFLILTHIQSTMITPYWWGFSGITVAIFFILIRRHARIQVGEHFFTQIVMGLLFTAPFFFFLSQDKPLLLSEFDGVIRHLQLLLLKDAVPSGEMVSEAGLSFFNTPPALLASISPANLITLKYTPAVFALFNIFLLILVSENMTRLSDIPVKWSNLPLVTIGGLLGVTLFNPFFEVDTLIHANTDLIYAITFFAATSPLLRKKGMPVGIGAIAPSCILAFLTGLHPMGIIASALILSVYIWRTALLRMPITFKSILSFLSLISLPTLSFMIWQDTVYTAALSGFITEIPRFGMMANTPYRIDWSVMTLLATLIVLGVAVAQAFDEKMREDSAKYMWLFVPAYLIFFYILSGLLLKQPVDLDHLQFLILLPLWKWATFWYQQTRMSKTTYKHPWSIGLSLALFFIMLQFMLKTDTQHRYDDAMMHTFNVGHIIATEYLEDKPVIVIETPERERYTLSLLKYAMTDKGGSVKPASRTLYDTAEDPALFLKRLVREGYGWVWLHTPTAYHEDFFKMPLSNKHSYLFKVTSHGFIYTKSFKHPSYTQKSLAARKVTF